MRPAAILCVLLLTLSLARAQEATPEPAAGWTIEQRCVGEPSTPPDDWSFEGTILMTGWAGIHAVSADYDTPYVVAHWGMVGGALSPNGQWYAMPRGYAHQFDTLTGWDVFVNEITVYRTNEYREYHSVPWQLVDGRSSPDMNPQIIIWLDNERFIFYSGSGYTQLQAVVVNPFTGETTEWENPINLEGAYLSPDLSRAVSEDYLYDFANAQQIADLPPLREVSWANDSSFFVAFGEGLVQINREGQLINVIAHIPEDEPIYLTNWHVAHNIAISSDNRYVAFGSRQNNELRLYLADLQNERVFDTCLTISYGMAWSPDGHDLALLGLGDEQSPVLVLDADRWSLYTVAYHTPSYNGGIIGWRADD